MAIYTPAALSALFEERTAGLTSTQLLTDRKNRRLLEAWCAVQLGLGFGRVIEACSIDIELTDEQREYDFHLITAKARHPFQLAEVVDRDRRRDLEYKTLTSEQLVELGNERPIGDSTYAAAHIKDALQKKVDKGYAGVEELHLLLYLNVNAYQVAWATMRNATEEECKRFASVWVITGIMFCCLWGGATWHGLVGWKGIESER